MGEGTISLAQLSLDKLTEHVVNLEENGVVEEELGQIVLGLRLVPRTKQDQQGETSGSIGKDFCVSKCKNV